MKKNFRKIPEPFLSKLERLQESRLVLFSTAVVSTTEDLTSFGIYLVSDEPNTEDYYVPRIKGKYTKENINGKEIVRKDLPKETFYNYVEAPNWGDPSNGTHTVALPYKRYPRYLLPPKNWYFRTRIVSEISSDKYLIAIEITTDFISTEIEDIFFGINMLQESFGNINVKSKEEDYPVIDAETVEWQIFPPEERDSILEKVLRGRNLPEIRRLLQDRLDFLYSLEPQSLVYGSMGIQSYIGAKFREDLVIFENPEYGNAIYFLYEDWRELSRLSRTQLLTKEPDEFTRITHKRGWENQVKSLLRFKLGTS